MALARCFQLGVDIVLVHSRYSVEELVDTVVDLVEQGVVTPQQIDEGLTRVLTAKWKTGIFDESPFEQL